MKKERTEEELDKLAEKLFGKDYDQLASLYPYRTLSINFDALKEN